MEITSSKDVLANCFLDYPDFNEHYKLITVDSSKKQFSKLIQK